MWEIWWNQEMECFFAGELDSADSKQYLGWLDLRSHYEVAYVQPRTPFDEPDSAVKLPALNLATDVDFPKRRNPLFISANHPSTVRADAYATGTSFSMNEI